jgi:hypothetical protein
MIGFLANFARRARDFSEVPGRPYVWLELAPEGILVRAQHKAIRGNHILLWEQIGMAREEVRSAMVDQAIARAALPVMRRMEDQREEEQAL